jgi:hypothetical protein
MSIDYEYKLKSQHYRFCEDRLFINRLEIPYTSIKNLKFHKGNKLVNSYYTFNAGNGRTCVVGYKPKEENEAKMTEIFDYIKSFSQIEHEGMFDFQINAVIHEDGNEKNTDVELQSLVQDLINNDILTTENNRIKGDILLDVFGGKNCLEIYLKDRSGQMRHVGSVPPAMLEEMGPFLTGGTEYSADFAAIGSKRRKYSVMAHIVFEPLQ